jgi:hypothetical protein
MPTDLVDALGPDSSSHPLVYVMSRDAIRPVPPRTQPEAFMSREFEVPTARPFTLTGNATISPDAPETVIDEIFAGNTAAPVAYASSSAFLGGCLSCRAAAAFDGNPASAWQSRFDAAQGAWAEVDTPAPVRFDHVNLAVIADGRHSVPTQLRLDVDGKSRILDLPAIPDKAARNAVTTVPLRFPALRGSRIRFTVTGARTERTRVFSTGRTRGEPVAIAEFGVPGVRVPSLANRHLDSGCRSDLVAIDGNLVPVRITGNTVDAQKPMGLAVTPCRGPLALSQGTHELTTAPGNRAGFSIDRVALASGTAATPLTVAQGHVTVPTSVPTPAQVAVTHNGATKMRAHVDGAREPFWLVLGQSRSPGWHARINGHDLGAPQLVDGYANGWLVTPPPGGSFDVVFEWTPQRQVWAAIWLSLLGALLCVGIIAITWVRRRSLVPTAATARVGDADADVAWLPGVTVRRGSRVRWVAPIVCGLLAGLAVAPWVGVLVAAVAALVVTRPRVRPWVMLAPAALLALCGVYMAYEQYHYIYPSVFEWPTLFPRARTLAWIAVVLLAADAVIEILRARFDGAQETRDHEIDDAADDVKSEPEAVVDLT